MKWFLLILLQLSLLFPLAADSSIELLLEQTGARLKWDPYLQSGSLSRQDKMVHFQVGTSYYLFDGKPEKGRAPHNENSQIMLSQEDFDTIASYLTGKNTAENSNSGYRVSVIILDPGHGGKDWGAYANYEVDGISTNLREKNINLDVALRAADILRTRFPGKEIAMTRSDDHFVALTERVRIAESYHFSPQEGMVFVSVHTNASLNNRGKGFEVWYLPDDFDRNLSDEQGELKQVLNSLWEEEFLREGYNLSRFILDNMEKQTRGEMPNRGLKQNAWYMLRNQNMASCLIELAFLTNEEDAARLRDTDFLSRSATALADGITDFIHYFEQY